ncbi:hypothetical protein [Cellulomonas edaphi]|uniref:FeoB-associated Cys-rich membrane protein n=1 Tax=Cellulomonas edaphi TaxID=3053468 RepID=A0ABT7SA03_9CELL|nr:hypothetical protein [Cellulomons edaphi]MDM7832456.1 hypothetical protein [Cellulomons edaphi]
MTFVGIVIVLLLAWAAVRTVARVRGDGLRDEPHVARCPRCGDTR